MPVNYRSTAVSPLVRIDVPLLVRIGVPLLEGAEEGSGEWEGGTPHFPDRTSPTYVPGGVRWT